MVKSQERRRKPLTAAEISSRFHLPLLRAAEELNVSGTHLKKICREYGWPRWPYRDIKKKEKQRLIRNAATGLRTLGVPGQFGAAGPAEPVDLRPGTLYRPMPARPSATSASSAPNTLQSSAGAVMPLQTQSSWNSSTSVSSGLSHANAQPQSGRVGGIAYDGPQTQQFPMAPDPYMQYAAQQAYHPPYYARGGDVEVMHAMAARAGAMLGAPSAESMAYPARDMYAAAAAAEDPYISSRMAYDASAAAAAYSRHAAAPPAYQYRQYGGEEEPHRDPASFGKHNAEQRVPQQGYSQWEVQ